MSINKKHSIPDQSIVLFPFIWFAISLIARGFQTSTTAIYFNAVFYWVLFIFYLRTKQFRFDKLFANWKSGKEFWIGVALTFLGMLIAFAIGLLPSFLLNTEDGIMAYRINSPLSLFLFVITLIPLPSVVEETFFRKNIISFRSNFAIVVTILLGSVLFGLSHTFNPIGVFSSFMWGIPLAIAYVKTKNIYIPITAHLMSNILMNGMDAAALFRDIVG